MLVCTLVRFSLALTLIFMFLICYVSVSVIVTIITVSNYQASLIFISREGSTQDE